MYIGQEYVGPNFKVISNNDLRFNCDQLMYQVIKSDENVRVREPCKITPALNKLFTMDGLMMGHESCPPDNFYEIQNGINKTWIWTADLIEKEADTLSECGQYGNSACTETCELYSKDFIRDKEGMVVGTQHPWAERGLLHYGAKHITTIEYMKIESQHPKLSTMHPVEAARRYLVARNLTLVDCIWTYSSLEHDGLGRYGDPINPYADLESIARAHCMLKPNGILFLGIPVGPDLIARFYHRIYGRYRMSLILPLWEPVDLILNYLNISDTKRFRNKWENQPIWVLKKKNVDTTTRI